MIAYIVAGLVVGAAGWFLKHDSDDPAMAIQLIVGVAGGVVGGAATNLIAGSEVMDLNPWGFLGASVTALVVLGLVQAGTGRRTRH